MSTKVKIALELLESELEVLSREQQFSVLGGCDIEFAYDSNGNKTYWRESSCGGGGAGDWTAIDSLGEVVITPNGSTGVPYFYGGTNGGNGSYWQNAGYTPPYGGTGGDGSGGGDGSSSNGWMGNPNPPSNGSGPLGHIYADAAEAASFAISHSLAWNEFYTTIQNVGPNTVVNTNTLLQNIIEFAPIESAKADWANVQQWKGIAIMNTAGRILGVTSAIGSTYKLVDDIFFDELPGNQEGSVSALNVADAAISVGSLLVKSNAVGFVIAGGWMLIKGEFED